MQRFFRCCRPDRIRRASPPGDLPVGITKNVIGVQGKLVFNVVRLQPMYSRGIESAHSGAAARGLTPVETVLRKLL
jgi:hypothetical protein